MADDRDVLFRMGFTEHPNAQAAMERMAKGVEQVQMRIGKSVDGTGDRIINQVNRIEAAMKSLERSSAKGVQGPQASTPSGSVGVPGRAQQSLVKDLETAIEQMNNARDQYVAGERGRVGELQLLTDMEEQLSIERAKFVGAAVEQIKQELETLKTAEFASPDYTTAFARVEEFNANMQKARDEQIKEAEKQAKKLADIQKKAAAEEEKDRKDAIRAGDAAFKERERIVRDEQKLANENARVWISAYEQQADAAKDAYADIERGTRQMDTGARRASRGIGNLARSAALLNVAQEGVAGKALQKLAQVQAVVDGIAGSYRLFSGAKDILEGLRQSVDGKAKALKADAAASRVAEAASVSLRNAMKKEALSAKELAAAHAVLNRNRAGASQILPSRGLSGRSSIPMPSGGRRVALGGGRRGGGVAAMGAASIVAGGGMAGGGELVGALMETTVAMRAQTLALKTFDIAKGGAIKLAAKLGLPALGSALGALAKVAGGVVTTFGTVIAAGASAVAGLAFAGKSAWDAAKSIKEYGLMGGSAMGSWTDTIASAEVSALSWIGTTTGAFDLIGNAAVQEAQGRMALYDEEVSRRRQLLDQIEAIEADRARQLRGIQEDFRDQSFQLSQSLSDDGNEKIEGLKQEVDRLTGVLSSLDRSSVQGLENRQSQLIGKIDRQRMADGDPNSEGVVKLREELAKVEEELAKERKSALQEEMSIRDRLTSRMQEQVGIAGRLADEEKKAVQDKADALERSIVAREREIRKIEEAIEKEKRGVKDIIDAKRDANSDKIKSAAQQFADLSKGEQSRLNELLKGLRSGEIKQTTRRQDELLGRVDTDETRMFREQSAMRRAKEGGFDTGVGRGLRQEQKTLRDDPTSLFDEREQRRVAELQSQQSELAKQRAAQQQSVQEASNFTGQNPAEIIAQLGKAMRDSSVSVVDESTLVVKIEENFELRRAEIAEAVRRAYEAGKKSRERVVEEEFQDGIRTLQQAEIARRQSAQAAG